MKATKITCESCSKSFTAAQHLKGHIFTVHEGHKDLRKKIESRAYLLLCWRKCGNIGVMAFFNIFVNTSF